MYSMKYDPVVYLVRAIFWISHYALTNSHIFYFFLNDTQYQNFLFHMHTTMHYQTAWWASLDYNQRDKLTEINNEKANNQLGIL